MKCLKLQLSYYYYRFWKADDRHIEILLPVSILIIGMANCSGVPNFIQIGQRTAQL